MPRPRFFNKLDVVRPTVAPADTCGKAEGVLVILIVYGVSALEAEIVWLVAAGCVEAADKVVDPIYDRFCSAIAGA